ncbi:MAG: hypothetical protein H7Y20_10730 [Bryobacteraceae bacterium]|nr:hypothetical protein [Bryobacteraceae bacterium]
MKLLTRQMKWVLTLVAVTGVVSEATPPQSQEPSTTVPEIRIAPACQGKEVIRGTVDKALPGSINQVRARIFSPDGQSFDEAAGVMEGERRFAIPLHSPLPRLGIIVVSLLKDKKEVAASNPLLVCGEGAAAIEEKDKTAEIPAKAKLPPPGSCTAVESSELARPEVKVPENGAVTISGGAPLPDGVVELCVNGEPRALADGAASGTPVANSLAFREDKFKLTLVESNRLKSNEQVRVIVRNLDNTKRVSADVKVKSDPCLPGTTDSDMALPTISYLRADATSVSGKTPFEAGKVTVCVNNVVVKGPIAFSKSAYLVALTDKLVKDQKVRVVVTSEDGGKRITSEADVDSSCKSSEVRFRIIPREGDNAVYGTGASSNEKSRCMVSVFVNGDGLQIVNEKAEAVWSVPTAEDGAFVARLRNSFEAGQCVTLAQFEEGGKPELSVFDDNTCPNQKSRLEAEKEHGLGKHLVNGKNKPTERNRQAEVKTFESSDSNDSPREGITSRTAESFLNFGRVRSYFAAGSVLSTEGDSFIRPDIFLAFNMTKNWLWGGPTGALNRNGSATFPSFHGSYKRSESSYTYSDKNVDAKANYRRLMIDTFFETRLTAIPASVVNCTNSARAECEGHTGKAEEKNLKPASDTDSFLASRKAATLQGGMVAPIVITTWTHRRDPHALSIGPLGKAGFQTPVGTIDQSGKTIDALSAKAFYVWYGAGARLGFHHMSTDKNVAPDLISYIDIIMGRFTNLDSDPLRIQYFKAAGNGLPEVKGCLAGEVPGRVTNPDCMYERYARPWRLGIEGLFKVPNTAWVFGFSANVRQNLGLGNSKTVNHTRDDLRFFIGTKFNIGTLLGKLSRLDDSLPGGK